jgi:UDPglucose 6-dehydrogenase
VLARDLGTEPLLAEATDSVNVAQTHRLARVVQSRLAVGDSVGILGLAYKPDTGVVDESPGVALARLLGQEGYEVHVYDPVALEAALPALAGVAQGSTSVGTLLEESDVVVITTPWREFVELPVEALGGKRPTVIDCWGIVSEDTYGDVIDIVRLGRAVAESSPVLSAAEEG